MDMLIGYKYFLRKVAGLLESGDNLTVGAASRSLNMRPGEFKQMLALMESKGDIKRTQDNNTECGISSLCCNGCGVCSNSKSKVLTGISYRLTESGKNKIMVFENSGNVRKKDIPDYS
jgi:hypothetical protein